MLDDEALQDLSSAARMVNNAGYRSIQNGKEIYNLIRNLVDRSNRDAVLQSNMTAPFVFTGQITDLEYFRDNLIMPKSAIDNIADDRIKEAVISTFDLAEKGGLIDVDLNNNLIRLTEKGEQYINRAEFVKESRQDRQRAMQKSFDNEISAEAGENTTRYVFPLSGTENDLQFFRFANNMDLKEVASAADSELAQKVFDNVAKWNNDGIINFTNPHRIALTEKGTRKLAELVKDGEQLKEYAAAAVNTVGTAVKSSNPIGAIEVTTKAIAKAIKKTAEAVMSR